VIGEDMIPNDRVGGSESGSSAPRPVSSTPTASTPQRPQTATAPASVPFSQSGYNPSSQSVPPFKPVQSRF
jgi:hypothetical protein